MKGKLIYWVLQFSGWGLYTFLALYILNNDTRVIQSELPLYYLVIEGIIYFFMLLFASHGYRYFIIKFDLLSKKTFGLLWGLLLMSVCFAFLFSGFTSLLYFFSTGVFSGVKLNAFVSGLILYVFWSTLYILFHFFYRLKNEEIKNINLKVYSTKVELDNLKSQLNPHFMFNSLNSIKALVDEEPELAKKSIVQLSNILRYGLAISEKNLVSLDEELKIVKDYLGLEKIRYEERLKIDLFFDINTTSLLIPPLLIQNLVENAIKHGVSQYPEGSILKMEIKQESDYIFIEVSNKGELRKNKRKGTGLENIQKRLALIYSNDYKFNIQEKNGLVVVNISFPKKVK